MANIDFQQQLCSISGYERVWRTVTPSLDSCKGTSNELKITRNIASDSSAMQNFVKYQTKDLGFNSHFLHKSLSCLLFFIPLVFWEQQAAERKWLQTGGEGRRRHHRSSVQTPQQQHLCCCDGGQRWDEGGVSFCGWVTHFHQPHDFRKYCEDIHNQDGQSCIVPTR